MNPAARSSVHVRRLLAVRVVGWTALALYVVVGAFPGWTIPGSIDLDGAWVLVVNQLGAGGFGREVAFTYGPLGFLLYPSISTVHVVLALALRVTVLAALAAPVLFMGRPIDRIVFALAQVAAFRLGLTFEYHLLVPCLLVAARWLAADGRGESRWAILAALAVVALFVKFSMGIAVGAIVGAAFLVRVARERKRALPGLAIAFAAVGAALVAIGAAALGAVGGIAPWLRRSWEMAGAYSEVMAYDAEVPASGAITLVAAGVVLALAGVGVWGARRGSAGGRLALLAAGPTFLAFKHAFVRQDVWHTTLFFPFLLVVTASMTLFASTSAERAAGRAAVALAAAASLWVTAAYDGLGADPGPALASGMAGATGAEHLRGWLDIQARRTELPDALARSVPPGLGEALGDRPVGIVPFRLGLCVTPGVVCVANPTLQTFAAYTAGLDEWSAEHYAGPRAPPWLMLHADGIDGRSPALDHPALWRALLSGYRVAPFQPGAALLLERRPGAPAAASRVELGHTTLAPGGWTAVPNAPGAVYAAVALELSWTGRLRRLFWRIDPVLLALEYANGERAIFRLVPGTARNGLPVDQVPLTGQDLAAMFQGDGPAIRRPVRMALLGDGLESYRSPIELTWSLATPTL